jgi:hypothetical protein
MNQFPHCQFVVRVLNHNIIVLFGRKILYQTFLGAIFKLKKESSPGPGSFFPELFI